MRSVAARPPSAHPTPPAEPGADCQQIELLGIEARACSSLAAMGSSSSPSQSKAAAQEVVARRGRLLFDGPASMTERLGMALGGRRHAQIQRSSTIDQPGVEGGALLRALDLPAQPERGGASSAASFAFPIRWKPQAHGSSAQSRFQPSSSIARSNAAKRVLRTTGVASSTVRGCCATSRSIQVDTDRLAESIWGDRPFGDGVRAPDIRRPTRKSRRGRLGHA